MLSTSFRAKMVTLHSDQNSWPLDLGAFSYKTFFFFKEFSICFLDLYICYLKFFVQKQWYCIPIKILDHSNLGAFPYKIYTSFFFFFSFISKEFSICFLDLYICYLQVFAQKCRHCIPVKNSWPVGLRGIFVQNLLEFFFFFSFHSKESSICFLDLYIRYKQVFVQKHRHCIPVKILD